MLTLPESVTVHDAEEVLRGIREADDGSDFTVDASALKEFDSAALALLLECGRRAHAAGRPFHVEGVPPKLLELARLYGLDEAIPELRKRV